MCIIIDTNMFGKFIDQSNADMAPIHKWLIGSGKLVYTTFGKFGEEIKNHQKM